MLQLILRRKLAAAFIAVAVLAMATTATAFACFNPPPNKTPHLVIIKKADHSSPVSAGEQIGFTVEVENTGGAAATGVSLSDTLPTGSGAGVTWAIVSDPHNAFELGTAGGHQKLELKSTTLSAGADYTVHITAMTSSTECSVYANSATLSASNASTAGPASATETCQKPSLSVTKTADHSPVSAGDPIGFTIKVANAGPGTATNVGLSDPLPGGTASSWVIASQTNSGQCSIGSGTLSCSGVGLASGASFSVHITSTTSLADCSTYPNTATASSGNAGSPSGSATIVCQKPSPSIVTTQDPASGGLGDTYKDTATLSGAVNLDGSGSITFKLYSAADCGGTVLDTESVGGISANGTVATPTGVVLQNAGTYYWVASFGGDSNNRSVSGGCNDEPVVVAKAVPSIVTSPQPASGAVGGTFKDTATLSDAVNLDGSGSITFKLYSAADCGGTVLDTETVSQINANGDYTTPAGFQIENAGTYYWVASFSGDSNNRSVSGGCNEEPVAVGQNASQITTVLSGSGGSVGVVVHDSAVLVGASADASGSVTYSVYSDSGCTDRFADGGTVGVVGGVVGDSNAVSFDVPGTFYWRAAYSGDGNNAPAVSGCLDERLVVSPLVDLAVTKVGSPSRDTVPGLITWTMVVSNSGPDAATGVALADPLPAGDGFVSVVSSQGSCTGGVVVSCSLGTVAAGGSVTVTVVTRPSRAGSQTNTVTVVGDQPEANTANNTASASVLVVGAHKPPLVACVAVSRVSPHQLYVGRKQTLTIRLERQGKPAHGVRVRITGPTLNLRSKPSNRKGVIKQQLRPGKPGILVFTPLTSHHCGNQRLGITGVFTPPVTG